MVYSWIPFGVCMVTFINGVFFACIIVPLAICRDEGPNLPVWLVITSFALLVCGVWVFLAMIEPEMTPYTKKVWQTMTGRE